MEKQGLFAEYDEYSQNRKYGTLKVDYSTKDNLVVVLTPNGFRQLRDYIDKDDIFAVLVQTNLGNRIKRYINRIGAENFTFDDKNEINSRVERDFGMFLGIEKEVNMVVKNNNAGDIEEIASEIVAREEVIMLV